MFGLWFGRLCLVVFISKINLWAWNDHKSQSYRPHRAEEQHLPFLFMNLKTKYFVRTNISTRIVKSIPTESFFDFWQINPRLGSGHNLSVLILSLDWVYNQELTSSDKVWLLTFEGWSLVLKYESDWWCLQLESFMMAWLLICRLMSDQHLKLRAGSDLESYICNVTQLWVRNFK